MQTLRDDALAIWTAGVDAVRADRLVKEAVRVSGNRLLLAGETYDLGKIARVAVVGAGKAAGAMAAQLEATLLPALGESRLLGWVNVLDNDPHVTRRIVLHAARPAGRNEPTAAGVAGAEAMVAMLSSLTADDLAICVLTGGASALLPLPVEGVTLADKRTVTRLLSAAGADIRQLNTVRKALSRVKGGGLARACRAGTLVTLAISDVLDDAPDVIGSGPTVDDTTTPADARAVLESLRDRLAGLPPSIDHYLRTATAAPSAVTCQRRYRLLANLATAVAASAEKARERGYAVSTEVVADEGETAEEAGRRLASAAMRFRHGPAPACFVSGGEPVVRLAPEATRGLGGRNQQLALAAAESLWEDGAAGICLLSGGTDGEDGPTDAAGAIVDEGLLAEARRRGGSPAGFLSRNDAYHFFEPLGGLLKTGPTHTNVCDVRVVLARPKRAM